MASLKLTIDRRRARKDGSFPLVFRLTENGVSRDITTGYYSKLNQWNETANCLRKTHPIYDVLSKELMKLESVYLAKILELERLNKRFANVQQLKEALQDKKESSTTVAGFWKQEIDLLRRSGRNGGARVYEQALSVLSNTRTLDIPFGTVDLQFLKQLNADLRSKGLKPNSVGVYFRTFRAVINKAIDAGLMTFQDYPFRRFKIAKEPTRPRTLSIAELQAYFNLNLVQGSPLYESWMIGKLMFFLIGVNFTDLVMMQESQIIHGRFVYIRAKTKKQYSIKLLPEAIEIINYFRKKRSATILGKLTSEQLKNKERLPYTIHQSNKVYNKHLKLLGKLIGCRERLTGYCFRYTTANIAKQLGYSKDLISEALGHSYGSRITGIYLESFALDHIDEMNANVCASLLQRKELSMKAC